MNRTTEILLYLFRQQFKELREKYKYAECVFDERVGKEQAVEDCEKIIRKVLTGKDDK